MEDAQVASGAGTSPEELKQADSWFEEALSLRDDDPEQAINLMARVLEVRNKAYGDTAIECAHTYMYYGQLLFEQAQASTDILGEQLQRAAQKRDAGSDDEDADSDEDVAAAEEQNTADDLQAKQQAGGAAGGSSTEEAATAPADTAAPAAPADAAGPSTSAQPAADGSSEVETVEAAGDADAGADAGDADDMQVAFEMLEVARVIFERHGGAEVYPSEMADLFLYLGDHCAEREEFAEAVEEYDKAAVALACIKPEPRRRCAEIYFKKALALQFGDELEAALRAITTARTKLRARIDELSKTAGFGGASGSAGAGTAFGGAGKGGEGSAGDASGDVVLAAAAGADALSAALAAYAAPAPPAAAAAPKEDEGAAAEQRRETAQQQLDAAAAAVRARREAEEVRGLLEEMGEKADELRSLIAERASMKNALAGVLRSLAPSAGQEAAAGQLPAQAQAQQATGLPGASSSGAAPVDLGVVGRGRRVAPVPAAAAAAPQMIAEAPVAGAATGTPLAAAETGDAGASGAAAKPGGGKRSMAELMGGGETMVGFGAGSKAKVQAVEGGAADAAPAADAAKRLRQEAPAAAEGQGAAAAGAGEGDANGSKE